MKPILYKSLVKFMDELAGYFSDGLRGVEAWLKHNLARHHEATAPPQLRANPQMLQMQVNMKTGQMINMMKQWYAKGKELFGEGDDDDVPMAEEPQQV